MGNCVLVRAPIILDRKDPESEERITNQRRIATGLTGAKKPDGQMIVVGRDHAELIKERSCRTAGIEVELRGNYVTAWANFG